MILLINLTWFPRIPALIPKPRFWLPQLNLFQSIRPIEGKRLEVFQVWAITPKPIVPRLLLTQHKLYIQPPSIA